MDICKMSDQEKSWHLCSVADIPKEKELSMSGDGPEWEFTTPNLYEVDDDDNPIHMPLAWRVLNWAETMFPPDYMLAHGLPPADAQRLWLDKILELAIEAGIIEEE